MGVLGKYRLSVWSLVSPGSSQSVSQSIWLSSQFYFLFVMSSHCPLSVRSLSAHNALNWERIIKRWHNAAISPRSILVSQQWAVSSLVCENKGQSIVAHCGRIFLPRVTLLQLSQRRWGAAVRRDKGGPGRAVIIRTQNWLQSRLQHLNNTWEAPTSILRWSD